MKLQNKLLLSTALLLTLSSQVIAGVARSVTIQGSAILTYPTDTSSNCVAQLVKNGCSGQNCAVGGKTLAFNMGSGSTECSGITLTIQGGSGSCSNSQAEFYLSASGNTYDISLVNGWSGPVSITGGATRVVAMTRDANSMKKASPGVYPVGCSLCTSRTTNDCGYNAKNSNSLTAGCSGSANCQITNDNASSYTVTFMSIA